MSNASAKKAAEAYTTLASLIAATRPEIKREDYPSHIAWMVALHKASKIKDANDV